MCSDWSYVITATLPKYMTYVLRLNIAEIGMYNALPWFLVNFVSYTFGFLLDRMVKAKKITVTSLDGFEPELFGNDNEHWKCERSI